MDKRSLDDRLTAYRIAMSLAQNMLDKGIISVQDYGNIDRMMTSKYGLDSCTIFNRYPLISGEIRGNMPPNT